MPFPGQDLPSVLSSDLRPVQYHTTRHLEGNKTTYTILFLYSVSHNKRYFKQYFIVCLPYWDHNKPISHYANQQITNLLLDTTQRKRGITSEVLKFMKMNDSAIYVSILQLDCIWLAGENFHVRCMSYKLCQHRESETISDF